MYLPLNQLHNRGQVLGFIGEIKVVLIDHEQLAQLIAVYPFLVFIIQLG